MRTDIVTAGIIGGLVGVAIGLATLPWSSAAVAEVAASLDAEPVQAPASPGPCPQLGPAMQAVDAKRLLVTAAKARVAVLEAERTAIAGDPIDWPEDIPLALGPDGAELLLVRAAEAADVDVLGVECEEFPCVAIISSVQGPDDDFSGFREAMEGPFGSVLADMEGQLWQNASMYQVGDQRLMLYLAELVPDEGYSREGDLAKRAAFRADALGDIVIAEEIERMEAEQGPAD